MLYQYKGTLLFLFPVGICYIRVNTKVVYSSFHSENCKYLIDLEEKIHSQPKYFLTVQKMCKQGLSLRLVSWPHILLYIMIVFFKIQACSIARKCVFEILVSVIVTVQYSWPPFQYKCGSSQHDAQALLMFMVLEMLNYVAVGFLMVLLLSKECTASFLGILNKGQLALYDFFIWILIACRCCQYQISSGVTKCRNFHVL